MRLNALLDVLLDDTVVYLNLTYRDEDNILTRGWYKRKVKDIPKTMKEYGLRKHDFKVTRISPSVDEEVGLDIIAREWSK